MFLVRQAKPEDVSTLAKLAKMVYFINLPPNEQIILDKVEHSARCFRRLADGADVEQIKSARRRKAAAATTPTGYTGMEQDSDFFMFTLEDAKMGGVAGTSQVRAHQGGPGNPNWSFRITEKRHYSESLRFGTTHPVGQLHADESGPSELGGLIIQPSYRGHAERPGRLLSFIRFHLIGLFRDVFAPRVLAEMMGPVSAEGDNIFWDAFGRKFVPVKFAEADRFCQHNRSFISELLPKEEIYLSLFPLEVQNVVGVVGKETIPARRLLENLGFKYRGFIDPFDGGPHLDALTDEIPLVRDTRRVKIGRAVASDRATTPAIVSVIRREKGFAAMQAWCDWDGEGAVRLGADVMAVLGVKGGDEVGFTPLTQWVKPDVVEQEKTPAKKRRGGRAKVRSS